MYCGVFGKKIGKCAAMFFDYLADEGTVKYKAITVLAGAVGCGIACFVPYKELINVLYGLNGYLGFVLVFAMVAYDLKTKMSLKHGVENETAGIDR